MTRAQFNALKAPKNAPVQSAPKTMSRAQFNSLKGQPKTMTRAEFNAKKPQKQSFFNRTMNQLIKPVSSASNALEDVGKIAGFGLGKAMGAQGSFSDWAKKGDIAPWQHQKDVWAGNNQRTYSDITREIGNTQDNAVLKNAIKTVGYGGDFLLDPLNKLKVLGLTEKGIQAMKGGKLALSAGEQATKGERALLQFGKLKTPQIINKAVLGGTTKLNDLIRGTETGGKVMTGLSKVSGKIRPAGVSREEFKLLTDAKTAARNTVGYTTDKSIEFGKRLAKTLSDRKATQLERASLLHAIEKGNEKLAPVAFQDLWKQGVDFKATNEEMWKKLGGSILEGHGLSHVATKEVAEQARKDAFKGQGGFKLTSTKTPQDIHRQWMKVGDNIVNLKDEGIEYVDNALGDGKGVFIDKNGAVVKPKQATAMEINNARTAQGKAPIFQEDLPIVAAKMGVSTGRKQAATEFLEATKGLKSEEAKALANEVHDKMVNPESLRKALQIFDSVQNIWKAQALVAPSYHIRNFAGNLWNNYLAGVNNPAPYVLAGEIQKFSATGKLSKPALWTLKKAGYGVDDIPKLIKEMETHGVIGTGQYLGDIAQAIDSRIGKTSYINPLSQNFAGYKANKLIGGGVEDNAKIAHYIFKKAEGYGAKQAAESVKKFLFDYGDLTDTEKGLLKRIMPFYTWTSKNIPLQIQQFIENPGKFSKIATAKKDIEQGVPQPDEKYMSDYMKGNAPIRTKIDKDGNTLYFLSGAWLPATSALSFLQDPVSSSLGMVTPALKLPYENLTGKGTFFKNTLGKYEDIQKYPGQKTSYLGLDMNPQTVNNLRSVRALNELNNLNPGGIFGGKNSPSIFQGILPNASNVRGGQHTPETTQQDRVLNSFVGKLQGYNPEQSKTYYDRDTQSRITEYNSEINRALSNNQTELASGIIKEMEQFVQERDGKPNKALEMYNLIGDQYFQDQAQNKMAEKNRANIRDEMKTQLRQGLQTGNNDMVMEALKKDPTYAEQALKDAIKEQQTLSPEQQKLLYQYEQAKTKKRLNPFFK